jgi:hypothetical protein
MRHRESNACGQCDLGRFVYLRREFSWPRREKLVGEGAVYDRTALLPIE